MYQIWVRGLPGSGKSTLCKELVQAIPRSAHISSGNLLRINMKSVGSPESTINDGELADSDVVLNLVSSEWDRALQQQSRVVVIDGFPKKVSELHRWIQGHSAPDLVVNISSSIERLLTRLAGRLTCDSCGAVYNSFSDHYTDGLLPVNPGRCDCGRGSLVKRADDNINSIKIRLDRAYEQESHILSILQNNSSIKQCTIPDAVSRRNVSRIVAEVRAKIPVTLART